MNLWNKPKVDNTNLLQEIYSNKKAKRYFFFVVGILLMAISFNLFIKPSHLTFGLSGLSIITEKLYKIDPPIVILIGNLVLLIASYVFLGIDKTKRTVFGSILYPLFVKLTDFLPKYVNLGNTEPVVIALCGALITGLGTGLVFKNSYTSGGTDVLKQILSQYGKMAYSKSNIYAEGLIMLFGGLVYGWQTFIYSLLTLYISGMVSDRVILGISEYKTLQIVTTKEEEVKDFIMSTLNHGVTEWEARGGYTDKHKKILLCAIPTREYFLAIEGLKKLDPDAFVIITDTYEIQGHK
jgi:uncharacterized membrane-anchored protein YitT (DUF2179 family)